MYGADRNLVRNNYIYDNYRSGIRLFHVPAVIRGDSDPADQQDTSNGNHYVGNHFGTSPSGKVLPNGRDITWDGAGSGNCAEQNTAPPGRAVRYGDVDFALNLERMPVCAQASQVFLQGNAAALGVEATCAAWDPVRPANRMPPGCSWFTLPPKPE